MFNASQFYRVTGETRVVTSQADADALGPEWFDSPKKAAAAKAAAEKKAKKADKADKE